MRSIGSLRSDSKGGIIVRDDYMRCLGEKGPGFEAPRGFGAHSKTWPTSEETKSNIQPHNFEVSSTYSRGQDMVNDAISNCVLTNTIKFVCESAGQEVVVHFTAYACNKYSGDASTRARLYFPKRVFKNRPRS